MGKVGARPGNTRLSEPHAQHAVAPLQHYPTKAPPSGFQKHTRATDAQLNCLQFEKKYHFQDELISI